MHIYIYIYMYIYNWYIDEVGKITHSCFVIILFSMWHSHAIKYFLPHHKSIFFLHCIIISIWNASDAILLILYETIHVDNEFNIFNVLWLYLSWIMFIHSFCNICAVLTATQLTDRTTDQHIFINDQYRTITTNKLFCLFSFEMLSEQLVHSN